MSRNMKRVLELVEEAQGSYRDIHWLRERVNLTLTGIRQVSTRLERMGAVDRCGDNLAWVR